MEKETDVVTENEEVAINLDKDHELLHESSVKKLRKIVENSTSELRKTVMKGSFTSHLSSAEWKAPMPKLLVFVSSTFTDTQLERNFLMDQLLFDLRERARPHGIEVIFVDMRWGVRDENTLDHKTWIECANGIHWCKEDSAGMCFLSLQADKYGYTPLPRSLDKNTVDTHLEATNCEESVKDTIFHWYSLDENVFPPQYVLKNLESTGDQDYWGAFDKMLTALHGIPFDTERCAGLFVGRSVTEWEVREALGPFPVNLEDREVSFCWSQRPSLTVSDPEIQGVSAFSDSINKPLVENHLKELREFMKSEIPQESIISYDTPLNVDDFVNPTEYSDSDGMTYLKQFQESVKLRMNNSLDLIIDLQKEWGSCGMGLGLPGLVVSEILHHLTWAQSKCVTFHGREKLIEEIISIVDKPHRSKPSKNDTDFLHKNRFFGVSSYVVGASGAGKTALMAKVAGVVFNRRCEKVNGEPPVVLIRFCGTSPGSRTARSLMVSLCQQVEFLFQVEDKKSLDLSEGEYEGLVGYFHSLLNLYPVLLFIDSLDQLSDQDQGRSEISFLKNLDPHPDTRVVVSCLPDYYPNIPDNAPKDENTQPYLFLCESRLKESFVPRVEVKMSTNEEEATQEAIDIMKHSLSLQKRTLNEAQWLAVREKLAEEKDKTALYITLAVGIVSQWSSFLDPTEKTILAGGVKPLILQYFSMWEREYGVLLVKVALGFLTYAVKGVSDTEMEDLLSLHEGVLDFVFQYATPSIRRLPSHVWLRLKGALKGLITEGEGGCQVWYHRQLREVAEVYLLSEKTALNCIMGKYFGNLTPAETRVERKIVEHGWTVCGRGAFEEQAKVNKRRCEEASHHLIASGMLGEAGRELTSFEGIFSKFKVGLEIGLIDDLIEEERLLTLKKSETTQGEGFFYFEELLKRVHHYFRWLRKDMYKLKDNLFEFSFSASSQPFSSAVRTDLLSLLKKLQEEASPVSFYVGLEVGSSGQDFEPLIAVLKGHKAEVLSVAFSADGREIVSGSVNPVIFVWNTKTGMIVRTLEGHLGPVNSVHFRPNGSHLASGSEDETFKVWDFATGSCLLTIKTGAAVVFIRYSPDSSLIAATMRNKSIKLYDTKNGKLVLALPGNSHIFSSVEFNPTGDLIASASDDRTIKLWKVKDGELVKTFPGHTDNVNSVTFSPDGLKIASGAADRKIKVWDIESGQVLQEIYCVLTVFYVTFSLDGNQIASAIGSENSSQVGLYDVNTDKFITYKHLDSINCVVFSPDGGQFVTASTDETMTVYSTEHYVKEDIKNRHSQAVRTVVFNPDGTRIFSGSVDCNTILWDTQTYRALKMMKHSAAVNQVVISTDGEKLVSCADEGDVILWNAEKGQVIRKFNGFKGWVMCIALSPDGSTIVTGSRENDLRVWGVNIWESKVYQRLKQVPTCLTFHPDGIKVLVGVLSKIEVRSIENLSVLQTICGNKYVINSIKFSPDGLQVMSVDALYLVLTEVKSGLELKKLEASEGEGIQCADYSPNGGLVVTGAKNKMVKIWDVETGTVLKIMKGQSATYSVVFSPDGAAVAVGFADKSIKLWFFNSS